MYTYFLVVIFLIIKDVGSTSMKMDFLPLADVRTDPIISPTCLADHVHTFYGTWNIRSLSCICSKCIIYSKLHFTPVRCSLPMKGQREFDLKRLTPSYGTRMEILEMLRKTKVSIGTLLYIAMIQRLVFIQRMTFISPRRIIFGLQARQRLFQMVSR